MAERNKLGQFQEGSQGRIASDERMKSEIEKNAAISKKLIENHYLHSNTLNFLADIRQQYRFNELAYTTLDRQLDKLQELIGILNTQANYFYADLGITGRDVYNKNDTSEEFGRRLYDAAGAREFSQKFLGLRRKNKKKEITKKDKKMKHTDFSLLRKTINSTDSINEMWRLFEIRMDNLDSIKKCINLDENVKVQKIMKGINTYLGEKVAKTSGDLTVLEAQKIMEAAFSIEQGKKDKLFHLKTINGLKSDQFKERVAGLAQAVEKEAPKTANGSKIIKSIYNDIKNEIFNGPIFYDIGDDYWSWLKREIRLKCGAEKISYEDSFNSYFENPENKEQFLEDFKSIIVKQKGVQFVKKDNGKNIVGFVGELSLKVSFDAIKNSLGITAELFGQEAENRHYVAKTYKTKSEEYYETDENGNEKKMYRINREGNDEDAFYEGLESGTDIKVTGKSGRNYNLQVKNSLYNHSPNKNMRLKSSMKLSTIVGTTKIGDSEKNMLIYLLTNYIYLNKNGRGPYHKGPRGGWDGAGDIMKLTKNRPQTRRTLAYINFYLQQTYMFLLSVESDSEAKRVVDIGENGQMTGNVGFIIGDTFVPIAAFLIGTLELLKVIRGKKRHKNMIGLGGTYGGLSGQKMDAKINATVDTDFVDNVEGGDVGYSSAEIQKQKCLIMKEYWSDNRKMNNRKINMTELYPSRLLAYGAELGDTVYNDLKLTNIGINIDLNKMQNLILKQFNVKG